MQQKIKNNGKNNKDSNSTDNSTNETGEKKITEEVVVPERKHNICIIGDLIIKHINDRGVSETKTFSVYWNSGAITR